MFDLIADLRKTCILCRNNKKPKSIKGHEYCQAPIAKALTFADDYRHGLPDPYNFDVVIMVREAQLVYLGIPEKMPKRPQLSPCDPCRKQTRRKR